MDKKVIKFSEFESDLRDAVLNALDEFAAEVMETDKVKGWLDCDLPELFKGADAHAKALAERINAGHEANSMYVSINMDS